MVRATLESGPILAGREEDGRWCKVDPIVKTIFCPQ
jgi:hypothetical protein